MDATGTGKGHGDWNETLSLLFVPSSLSLVSTGCVDEEMDGFTYGASQLGKERGTVVWLSCNFESTPRLGVGRTGPLRSSSVAATTTGHGLLEKDVNGDGRDDSRSSSVTDSTGEGGSSFNVGGSRGSCCW